MHRKEEDCFPPNCCGKRICCHQKLALWQGIANRPARSDSEEVMSKACRTAATLDGTLSVLNNGRKSQNLKTHKGHVHSRARVGDFRGSAGGAFDLEPETHVAILIRYSLLWLQLRKKRRPSLSMNDPTDDLKKRWDSLNARATEEVKNAWWKRILESYTAPSRHYHDIQSLHRMFLLYDRCKDFLANRYALAMAIFFHNICYDAKSISNEHESALEFEKYSGETVVDEPERIIDLIERRAAFGQDQLEVGDAEYFSDLQLAILGSSEEEYEVYKRNLRLECCHLNDDAYRAQRLKLLKALLLIPNIFRTNFFRDLFEKQSRENVQKEIDEMFSGN
uniref:NR LBD domain-containing protein n=1 Tax=Trichuris muris TaxID=70415 RepID=A0A5S6Q795_TRIMR